MSRGQPAWRNSTRRQDLPANWPALRDEAGRRNPDHVCHRCRRPGGEALDHMDGDRFNNAQDNLDWIHDWRSVKAGVSPVNCHAQKTAADRPTRNRVERHPALAALHPPT
jgi:hypothetical protein